MNKLGIWGITIAAAFVIGVLSANPVVEGKGGWQGALEIRHFTTTETDHLDITINDSDVTPNSVVILSVDEVPGGIDPTAGAGCGIARVEVGKIVIDCAIDELEVGSTFNYVVINP